MKRLLFSIVLFLAHSVTAQPGQYSTMNGHAHNDYEHNVPFLQAYRQGFGSIEVDVLLINDSLFVAHDTAHTTRDRLFDNTYLQPLVAMLESNKGHIYADSNKHLLLLIDLKTPANTTLPVVMKAIERYPQLIKNNGVRFVITGNQPPADSFHHYPAYIHFDGNLDNPQHIQHARRIALFSANFKKYGDWNGKGVIAAKILSRLKGTIDSAHALQKPVRFWGAPDNIHTWYTFTGMGIDLINTDHVEAFARFMATLGKSSSINSNSIKPDLSSWPKARM